MFKDNSIIRIKKFCRLMEVKEDDSKKIELSFLISSNNVKKFLLHRKEIEILSRLNGLRTIKEISEETCLSTNFIFSFLEKFKGMNFLEILTDRNVDSKQYSRHDLFFDMCFQQKNFTEQNITNKSILIVGCGGIGNNILLLITRMGVKNLILLDYDLIELSNLTRQFFFDFNDIGKLKTDVLYEKIKSFDQNISIKIINKQFNKDIISELQSIGKKIDFAFVSADTPPLIVRDSYEIFTKLKIPYTTVGYLNDFAIFGPIIDEKNIEYENFIYNNKQLNELNNLIFKKVNSQYQAPSFGPINMFSSSCAVYDMIKFFHKKNEAISYNKKIIFNFQTLEKRELNFSKIKIGIFNASSSLGSKYIHRVKKTRNFFEKKGFCVNLGNLTNLNKNKYVSGNYVERADEFNKLLRKNDVLMSMIGGYNSSSILPYIDYEYIKLNKTKIVGYSDTTAILLAVYKKTGVPTYYGPAFLPSFYEQDYIKKWNINSFINSVINNASIIKNPEFWTEEKVDWSQEKIPKKNLIKNKLISFNDGIVEGRLIGGNLNTLVSIYGTEFMPEILNGDILFIEDSYKRIDECERNFAFLRNTGILNKVSAVIIGKSEHFNDLGTGKKYYDLFLEFLDKKIPILAEYDCSHTLPMNVLKIGSKIRLNTFNHTITILN